MDADLYTCRVTSGDEQRDYKYYLNICGIRAACSLTLCRTLGLLMCNEFKISVGYAG